MKYFWDPNDEIFLGLNPNLVTLKKLVILLPGAFFGTWHDFVSLIIQR